ncbi:putative sucrose:sucrose fructosyltransferase [Helianthus anomalus]
MSVYGSGVKYVLKQSGDENRHDWYAIGSYDAWNDKWYPDDPNNKVLRHNFPRTVTLDIKTQTNLIQWPIEEVEMFRFKNHFEFKDIELRPGSIVPLNIGSTTKFV